MTAKEKSEELFNKFYAWYPNQDAQFIAKQCALMAVDELIHCSISYDNYNATWASQVKYWQEVKQELEKI